MTARTTVGILGAGADRGRYEHIRRKAACL